MSEQIHLQQYQRFFAILFSVVPGLNAIVALAGLTLWLIADIAEADWGVGIGVAALVALLSFIGWVFLGMGVRAWAERKPTGLLVGLCSPFLVVDTVFMAWLFYDVVIKEREEEAEAALNVAQALSQLV